MVCAFIHSCSFFFFLVLLETSSRTYICLNIPRSKILLLWAWSCFLLSLASLHARVPSFFYHAQSFTVFLFPCLKKSVIALGIHSKSTRLSFLCLTGLSAKNPTSSKFWTTELLILETANNKECIESLMVFALKLANR